jgi:5-methylcytosine-specific restriction endonuclease McrA
MGDNIMASHSAFLDGLSAAEKSDLDKRLYDRQSGKCFICDHPIDLIVHQGQLEVDHIEPLAEGGADSENNFALVHSPCNRQLMRLIKKPL